MLARFEIVDFSSGLVIAFVLAALIGVERQWRQRSEGLRTNVLVAVGAAAFVSLGGNLTGVAGAGQFGAYVISGAALLGAGIIVKDGGHSRGLNAAATLWCSAAVGVLSGIGLLGEAFVLTLLVLASNALLRPLVNAINRASLGERSEATYQVRVAAHPDSIAAIRDQLDEALEAARYPIQRSKIEKRSANASELVVTLISGSAVTSELDAICIGLEHLPEVLFATWTSQAGVTT